MSERNVNSLSVRLERLERENRILKKAAAVLLIGITALVVMGQASKKDLDSVEAHRFVLIDEDGKPRVAIARGQDGNIGLRFTDRSSQVRIALEVEPDGEPYVFLSDSVGRRRIAVTVNQDGSPGMSLLDSHEKARLGLSSGEDSSGILFTDTAGKTRAALGAGKAGSGGILALADDEGALRVVLTASAAPVLKLYGKQGNVVWKAP